MGFKNTSINKIHSLKIIFLPISLYLKFGLLYILSNQRLQSLKNCSQLIKKIWRQNIGKKSSHNVDEIDGWCQFHQHFSCEFFCKKRHFGSFSLVTFKQKKLPKRLLYVKFARKTLMKLTTGWFQDIDYVVFLNLTFNKTLD